MTDLSKFDALRSKTENQLVRLINTEVDLGVRDARLALWSTDSWAIVEECHRRAKRAYAKASRWIRLVGEVVEHERGPWEAKLEHLREMLEGLSVLASPPPPTEDKIPTLARALWKARDCPEGSPDEDWFRAERALKSHSASVGS